MHLFLVSSGAVLGALSLGLGLLLWRRLARDSSLTLARALRLMTLGAVAGAACYYVENSALAWALSETRGTVRVSLAPLLATVVFFAPLEEAIKASLIWGDYRRRRLVSGRLAAVYAVLSVAGFACSKSLLLAMESGGPSGIMLLRLTFALPAHFFFAGLWGYTLGGSDRDRAFGFVWLMSSVFHGFYSHIVFGQEAPFLVIVVPLLILMVLGLWALARKAEPQSGRLSLMMLDPSQLSQVREVMVQPGRPLLIHWIFLGGAVTVGVMLSLLALSIFVGHRFGVDFSLIEKSGVSAIVPVALLGSSQLLAFPLSAYLVARASAARSVLEPAWATVFAVLVILVLFSVTEPKALVLALGTAPVGFVLACGGAWLGLER